VEREKEREREGEDWKNSVAKPEGGVMYDPGELDGR
jgi:hypothetical protein